MLLINRLEIYNGINHIIGLAVVILIRLIMGSYTLLKFCTVSVGNE
ncbi:hypothetical protein [Clostridium magnum]|nr:hypothetical protein [Clostridium magnum]